MKQNSSIYNRRRRCYESLVENNGIRRVVKNRGMPDFIDLKTEKRITQLNFEFHVYNK